MPSALGMKIKKSDNSCIIPLRLPHNTTTSRRMNNTDMEAIGMARNNSNTLVIPQASAALDQMKYEVAQELGIQFPQDGYYGNMTTRDTGSIGGMITRRLVQIAEQHLSGGSRF